MVPNDWTIQGACDPKGQADWYRAMFEACAKRDWVSGMALWSWTDQLYAKNEAMSRSDYEIFAKPSELVVAEYYGRYKKN